MGRHSRQAVLQKDIRTLALVESRKLRVRRAMSIAARFVVEMQSSLCPTVEIDTFVGNLEILAKFAALGAFTTFNFPTVDPAWIEAEIEKAAKVAVQTSKSLQAILESRKLACQDTPASPIPPTTTQEAQPHE
jgi:hypothetical protein